MHSHNSHENNIEHSGIIRNQSLYTRVYDYRVLINSRNDFPISV